MQNFKLYNNALSSANEKYVYHWPITVVLFWFGITILFQNNKKNDIIYMKFVTLESAWSAELN